MFHEGAKRCKPNAPALRHLSQMPCSVDVHAAQGYAQGNRAFLVNVSVVDEPAENGALPSDASAACVDSVVPAKGICKRVC